MRADDLLVWIRAVPFVPFRMRMNSGRTYDIRHPEMLKVGRNTLFVFTFRGDAADPFEHAEMLSLVLIESVEPIEVARSA